MNDLGKRISSQRRRQGWTQAELGTRLNVTAQAVSKWENNISEPDVQTLLNMASLFGVSLDQMLTGVPTDITDDNNEAVDQTQTVETRAITGFCTGCGKILYEGEAAVLTPAILCEACKKADDERKAEEKRQKELQERKEEEARQNKLRVEEKRQAAAKAERRLKFRRAMIWSTVISVVVTAIVIAVSLKVSAFSVGHVFLWLFIAYGIFAFSAELFFGSDFVFDIVDWGLSSSIRFPGIIFSLDIEGCLFFIGVKILFAVISFIAGVCLAALALCIGMICSAFMFPFTLSKEMAAL